MEEKTRDLHRSSTCSTLSSLRSQARYHSSSYKFKLYSFGVLDNNMMPKLAYFGHSLQGPLSTSKPKPIIDVLQDVIFGRKDKDLLVKKVNMFASLHFGKSTIEFREHLPLRGFWLWVRELLCNRIPMEELVDSDLNGKISPECWDAVTSIAQRCIEYEADERPTMGEVELLLERAFSLQQQADDITNTNAAHYTLSSTTYIHGRPSICIDANNTEDILSHQFSRADLALMTGNFNETKIIGKGCYAAPEWSEGHDFTDKCDVYSFGIVLLQVVFTSKLPLIEGESDPILKGKIAPQCWEVFLDITRRCLKFGPNERPTINEVMTQLEHALALQEEADANTSDEYNLLSMTFDDDALLGRRLC
ncbi:hypothetical protein HN51_006340 [Arachis hypogaea]